MTFVETQFPNDIALGCVGGPTFSTDIVETFGGFEQRNINWSASRGEWHVGQAVKTRTQLATLIAFFRARRGRAIGFRFKDWSDFSASNNIIGVAVAAQQDFQLVKSYTSGGVTVDRTITKPVSGTVHVFRDSVEQMSGWTVNTATGVVHFTSGLTGGEVISATFEFDVPVRFDTDQLEITHETYEIGGWLNIPIVELRV